MVADIAIFVSKRLQRAAAALLCLIALQGLTMLSASHPELTVQPTMVRVAIGASTDEHGRQVVSRDGGQLYQLLTRLEAGLGLAQ